MSSWISGGVRQLGGWAGKGGQGGGSALSMQEKQAEDAKQWSEGFLGTGDEGFFHSREATQDEGVFKLSEVRARPKQADRGGSRLVRLPKGNYEQAPQIAKGLKSCDLNFKAKDHFEKQSMDLELNVFADTNTIISPLIQAWMSDEKTHLIYDAEMVWMEAKQEAKDCMFLETSFDMTEQEHSKSLKFPRPATKGAEYEVIGWLKGFRFATDNEDDYVLDFWPSKVTAKGFTANASGSSSCERISTMWIVYPKDKNKVASGSFSADEAEGRKENSPEATGQVEFPEGKFDKAPTVVTALSQFDLAGGRDLRIGVEVTDVTNEGFSWKLHTWGDGSKDALHGAEATWIALGFV